jgi:cyclohexanone monooxygenase
MDNFTSVISGGAFDTDLVNDGWTDLIGGILLAARRRAEAGESVPDPAALIELADFQKMERVRARVDSVVRDRTKAEALKPWYNVFCKRPCFHDQYLDTFNRPTVHLVDTQGRGVERITENAVIVGGVRYEVDCLVYATGFEVGTEYARRTGFEVVGRDGLTLTQKWKAGVETLHGFFSRGFPNCLFVMTSQTGQSANFQHILDEQSKHVGYVLQRALKRNIRTIEPTDESERDWVDKVVRAARGRIKFLSECTPGYYNSEGAALNLHSAKNGAYWKGPNAFLEILNQWRNEDKLAGLEVT